MREVNKLVETGVLKDPRDAYYLSIEELIEVVRSGYANQDLIEERKSAYRSYAALKPPRIIFFRWRSTSRILFCPYSQRRLAGLGVSTGIVEGRARVVKKFEDAHIEKGIFSLQHSQILVGHPYSYLLLALLQRPVA